MDAIEKIIAEMKQQAAAENDAYQTAEKKKIDEQYAADLTQLQTDFEKQKTRQLTAIEGNYRQKKNRQQVEIRQNSLQEKQDFLASLFQRAAEEMANWSAEEAQQFAEAALKQLPLKNTVRLFVGEKSNYFSQEWVNQVNQSLPYQLTLMATPIKNQAGFIVDDQGIQYNFIFENLVKDVQGELSVEIAQQLFK